MNFKPNRNFHDELRRDPAHDRALARKAEGVRRIAAPMAHTIMPRKDAGRSIVVDTADGVELVNTDHGGHIEEFGSVNSPAYAPLRRAVLASGLAFVPIPKP